MRYEVVRATRLVSNVNGFFNNGYRLFRNISRVLFRRGQARYDRATVNRAISKNGRVTSLGLCFLPTIVFVLLRLLFHGVPDSLFFRRGYVRVLIGFVTKQFFLSLVGLCRPIVGHVSVYEVGRSGQVHRVVRYVYIDFPRRLHVRGPGVRGRRRSQ